MAFHLCLQISYLPNLNYMQTCNYTPGNDIKGESINVTY